ncbi:MAG: DnaD domain protein [Oscillospiraceae bacterium]|nr:DnaD domain protein [Oscillospiraceae bacterium]
MDTQRERNLITPEAADLLISKRDGHMTLLFLYLCRTGCQDREKASRDLFLPPSTLNEAYERLEMIGLLPLNGTVGPVPARLAESSSPTSGLSEASGGISPPSESLPPYTADDVKNRASDDNAFSALIDEARLVIGRHLSTQDLIRLLGIYDYLDFPAEVLMILMHFVADQYREKYGPGRRPSIGAFEREARLWREKQISDFDAAERYIQSWRERLGLDAEIRDAMQIIGRDFTATERRYVDDWVSWGFRADAIALAYDKTVTNTRKFSPGYMNRILMNWHEKGLHSLEEIREKDRPAAFRASASSDAPTVPDPDAIQKIVAQI